MLIKKKTRVRCGLRIIVAHLTMVGVVLGVTACSGGSGQRQQDNAELQLPQKNRAEWVMPLDEYIVSNAARHLSDYAEDLAAAPCVAKAGYSWNAPWQSLDGWRSATVNAVRRQLFNVQIAAQWGYHDAPREDPTAAAWKAFAYQSISDGEHDIIMSCLDQVRKKELPSLPSSTQLPNSLEQAAYEAALQDRLVVSAADKWHECMASQGVPDLPRSPDLMPSDSLRKRFSLGESGQASAAEIALASADARCEESSGWAAKMYGAEWDRGVAAIQGNGDALEAIKRQVDDYNKTVLEVISRYAPVAPASSTVPTP